MCSTSRTSASCSIVVPLLACSTSSDLTATLTSRPGLLAVASPASFSTRAVWSGSRSSAPTAFRCQPSSTRPVTVSSMIVRSGPSSSCGRLRLSVDSSHSVTTSTPACLHHASSSKILSAPFLWPLLTSVCPADLAQRRLPSVITPTCRGIVLPVSEDSSLRSYSRYTRSRYPMTDLPRPERAQESKVPCHGIRPADPDMPFYFRGECYLLRLRSGAGRPLKPQLLDPAKGVPELGQP